MSQNKGPNTTRQALISSRILNAVDDFFRFVAEFEIAEAFPRDPKHFESLFTYFDEWALDVGTRYQAVFYLDWENNEKIWDSFLQLIPTIYVSIIDAYYKNPDLLALSKLDQVTGERIIEKRTVSSILPIPLEGESDERRSFRNQRLNSRPEYMRIAALVVGGAGNWPEVDFKPKRRRR